MRSLCINEGHFILADTHSPSSLPTRGQYKVWDPIIPVIIPTFGMMKTRFRAIFLQVLEVITACAILHNICLRAGDIVDLEDESEEDVEVEEDEDERENGLETVSGALWCDRLSAEVSAQEYVPPEHDYF
eukprot:superscaffoldBa00000051_g879